MKKLSILLVLIALNFGCDDTIEPFGDFRDQYGLFCVLDGRDSLQTVIVSKNYGENLNSPYDNETDPNVKDAIVRVWYGDSVEVFDQVEMDRQDTSRYKGPLNVYQKNFNITNGKEYKIEALMNNGKKIRGITKIPDYVNFNTSSTRRIPDEDDEENIYVSWSIDDEDGLYVLPKYKIIYLKNENGKDKRYEKVVPDSYKVVEEEYIPIYPKPTIRRSVSLKLETITRALEGIPQGHPRLKDFKILVLLVELNIYDKNLTNYYSSTNEFDESFSIALDETEYSNIDGGYGFIGSITRKSTSILFDPEYIQSFGYVYGLKN